MTCTHTSADILEEITWYHNGTSIAPEQTQWVSNKRICTSKGRQNCSIETTFNLIIEDAKLENSGVYSCATDDAPNGLFYEIIDRMYFVFVQFKTQCFQF